MLWRLFSIPFLVLFLGLKPITPCMERFFFSGVPGVPTVSPLLATTAAKRLDCVKTCMDLEACKSLTFSPGAQGCRLFSRRFMKLDLDTSSTGGVVFNRAWHSCPEEKNYFLVPGTDRCVREVQVELNYSQAALTCAEDGAHLIFIETADLLPKLKAFTTEGWFYVGANDLAVEGQYLWLDGSSVNHSLFFSGEPSDDVSQSLDEDCLVVALSTGIYLGLGDNRCDEGIYFLCSLPLWSQ